MGLFEKISARIELFRLEQRYTKRRNRRSTFVSDAVYVDGEYIYQTPSPTKRHSVVLSSSSKESVLEEDIHGIRAHYDRMEREAALRAQCSMTVTEVRNSEFGEYGVLKIRGQTTQGTSPADATSSKRGWGSARTANRRSMMTVQEARWEEGRR